MPQVKPANAKYQYDMKSIIQQSHMTKCQKYDNRREDRLLNRKLEELRAERRKVSQLRIVEKWAILNELTRFWNTRQANENDAFQKYSPEVTTAGDATYRKEQESRPLFPPPLARPTNPPSPVARRPRSFRTIKAESFLIMTGPGINAITSLSGRSLQQRTPSSYAKEPKSAISPSSSRTTLITANAPCASPRRPKTPGLNQMVANARKSDGTSTKSSPGHEPSSEKVFVRKQDSAKKMQSSSSGSRPVTAKSTGTYSDRSSITHGSITRAETRRPHTNRQDWAHRPLSSTSCASSVSLRAYFAGDTVEDLFPGVEIGKVNLPKTSRHIIEGYPEGANSPWPLVDPIKLVTWVGCWGKQANLCSNFFNFYRGFQED